MIKKLFSVLLFLCLFQCVALSAPNYDPNNVTTEWDPTYNINLRKKLENEFYKRHYIDDIIQVPMLIHITKRFLNHTN